LEIDCSESTAGVCDLDYTAGTKQIKTRFETRITGNTKVISPDNVEGELSVQQDGGGIIFAMGANRVTSAKPFTAKAGMVVEGNLTVTGTITGANTPVTQVGSVVGLWQGVFNGYAGAVHIKRLGDMVTVRIGYFEVNATTQTSNEGVFSEVLPTWARPTSGTSYPETFIVTLLNGTSTSARLYINSAGKVSFRPLQQWSIGQARPEGVISVTYFV
jgi:hypothetical protein